jgi:hypothetical protein
MPDNGTRIIDIDGHVREADDLFEKYLEAPFRARAEGRESRQWPAFVSPRRRAPSPPARRIARHLACAEAFIPADMESAPLCG